MGARTGTAGAALRRPHARTRGCTGTPRPVVRDRQEAGRDERRGGAHRSRSGRGGVPALGRAPPEGEGERAEGHARKRRRAGRPGRRDSHVAEAAARGGRVRHRRRAIARAPMPPTDGVRPGEAAAAPGEAAPVNTPGRIEPKVRRRVAFVAEALAESPTTTAGRPHPPTSANSPHPWRRADGPRLSGPGSLCPLHRLSHFLHASRTPPRHLHTPDAYPVQSCFSTRSAPFPGLANGSSSPLFSHVRNDHGGPGRALQDQVPRP